jgi:hypothetical protein
MIAPTAMRRSSEQIAEIEALVGPGAIEGLDFEAIETATRRRALSAAARAVERRVGIGGRVALAGWRRACWG